MTPGDKVNILLVDDQPGKLLTYEAILSELNENLVKTSSGNEALQQLLRQEFAVVLVDVCMPNIDGFELASLIRNHPRCERTAIIFISAIQQTNLDQIKGYESGAVDYLSVPVVPELLRARVRVFCDLYRKTAALEQMNRQLEMRVAERTAELERDLEERKRLQEALQQSDRRKDEFLAVLAHELRNPLAPIRTAADIMRVKQLTDPALMQCRDVIGRQVEQLTRLVDDLLDVSRITSGKLRLQKTLCDVSGIVQRAVETQKPILDERRQDLRVELPAEPLILEGDLTRLSEALANLLNNAAKYSNDGGKILLRVERVAAAEVVIRVKDNGVGIPPKMLPRVFELFTQVDQSLHRSQGGLGIGLALVRNLVELHGGTVEGFSEGIGQGSEFVMRLPLRADKLPAMPEQERVVAIASGYGRILVVDDNTDAAEMLATMLRFDGAEVLTAGDGAAALLAIDTFGPDLVLLDIGMPGMNGYEVARAIRAHPSGGAIMLVAQTGWGQEEDRRRAKEAGFDEHITKPVDRAQLMRLISRPRRNDRNASNLKAR
jgi:signal transduction histidine kinase